MILTVVPDTGYLIFVGVEVIVGALLYLDVIRSRRSGWWLLGIWAFRPALLVYIGLRVQDRRAARAKQGSA